jgi:HAMP domain-containing protein
MSTTSAVRAGEGKSLEYRVPVVITGLLVVLLSVTVLLAYHEVHTFALVAGQERLERVSTQLSALLEPGTQRFITTVREMAASEPVQRVARAGGAVSNPEVDAALTPRLAAQGVFAAAILDSNRRPVYSLPSVLPIDVQQADFSEEGGYSSWIERNDTVFYVVASPILDADTGRRLGYVAQVRSFGGPGQTARQVEDLLADANLFFADNTGAWASLDGTIVRHPELDLATGPLPFKDTLGTEYLAHATKLASAPWTVVVGKPRSAFLVGPAAFLRKMALLLLTIVATGASAAWILGRRFTRPLRELSLASEAIAEGDYSRRVDVDTPDELGMLAHSFNSMAEQVQSGHDRMQ